MYHEPGYSNGISLSVILSGILEEYCRPYGTSASASIRGTALTKRSNALKHFYTYTSQILLNSCHPRSSFPNLVHHNSLKFTGMHPTPTARRRSKYHSFLPNMFSSHSRQPTVTNQVFLLPLASWEYAEMRRPAGVRPLSVHLFVLYAW